MPVVLICASSSLEDELNKTLLWRADMERHEAVRYEQALSMAVAARPDVVVVDRVFPRALDLVGAVRRDPSTRGCSMVVVADGDFEPAEVELLEAGANAILRFPSGDDWDTRLDRLLNVPVRREARFSVSFAVETTHGGETMAGQARNLSAHGMLLQSLAPLAIGDLLSFSFALPDAAIDGSGTVMRHAGGNHYGVFFEQLERDGRTQIQRFVGALG
jgi:hypothetical protein